MTDHPEVARLLTRARDLVLHWHAAPLSEPQRMMGLLRSFLDLLDGVPEGPRYALLPSRPDPSRQTAPFYPSPEDSAFEALGEARLATSLHTAYGDYRPSGRETVPPTTQPIAPLPVREPLRISDELWAHFLVWQSQADTGYAPPAGLTPGARPYGVDEIRLHIAHHVLGYARHWHQVHEWRAVRHRAPTTLLERLDGALFSTLALFDGTVPFLPTFELVALRPGFTLPGELAQFDIGGQLRTALDAMALRLLADQGRPDLPSVALIARHDEVKHGMP